MTNIKIWLDDERDPVKHTGDKDWIWVKYVEDCVYLLNNHGMHNISELSLDHDLGSGVAPGYDVLLWIEEQVGIHKKLPPKQIYIHTANPSAKDKMMAARHKIYQLADELTP